ncbi:7718_t:CDS:2, partial [Scutellospora calospora]
MSLPESSSDLSSDDYSSEEFEKIESSSLYDQLQDLFYDGRDDNETIINTVFDFIRSNPEKYGFDINWWSNEKDFILIKEKVQDTILGYSSVLEYYNTDDELKKYEESNNFNCIINREAMRLYRDFKRQQKILQDIKIDRAEKRELMRDKEVNYYCRGVNRNVYLYICELAKVEELHMKHCDL